MAYNSNPPRAEYTSGTSQSVFPFVFKVYFTSDLKVYQTLSGNEPDDVADLLELDVDYTATINGDAGGEVTLTVPASSGDAITILRSLDVNRFVEYQTSGDLLADTLNDDQEYQTYLISDQAGSSTRYIKLSENSQGVDSTLPSPNALEYLRWNDTGSALENVGVVAESAVGETVSLDTTNFNLNLTAADDNVQAAMETLDELVGGAGAVDDLWRENIQIVSIDYTVPSGSNASVVGDITINDGVTITVSDGSTLVIL